MARLWTRRGGASAGRRSSSRGGGGQLRGGGLASSGVIGGGTTGRLPSGTLEVAVEEGSSGAVAWHHLVGGAGPQGRCRLRSRGAGRRPEVPVWESWGEVLKSQPGSRGHAEAEGRSKRCERLSAPPQRSFLAGVPRRVEAGPRSSSCWQGLGLGRRGWGWLPPRRGRDARAGESQRMEPPPPGLCAREQRVASGLGLAAAAPREGGARGLLMIGGRTKRLCVGGERRPGGA